mmetsp:Transcript_6065/g.7834  ORF Transcript_6065/g.7834 Transcript_6065/m.7834 type:complete len:168 (+) Transcript_6065:43-546(+)
MTAINVSTASMKVKTFKKPLDHSRSSPASLSPVMLTRNHEAIKPERSTLNEQWVLSEDQRDRRHPTILKTDSRRRLRSQLGLSSDNITPSSAAEITCKGQQYGTDEALLYVECTGPRMFLKSITHQTRYCWCRIIQYIASFLLLVFILRFGWTQEDESLAPRFCLAV